MTAPGRAHRGCGGAHVVTLAVAADEHRLAIEVMRAAFRQTFGHRIDRQRLGGLIEDGEDLPTLRPAASADGQPVISSATWFMNATSPAASVEMTPSAIDLSVTLRRSFSRASCDLDLLDRGDVGVGAETRDGAAVGFQATGLPRLSIQM